MLEMPSIVILIREREIRRSEVELASWRPELCEILSQKKKMKSTKGSQKGRKEERKDKDGGKKISKKAVVLEWKGLQRCH